MKKKDLEFFKKMLNQQKLELLNQGNSTLSGLKDPVEFLPDPTDRASFEADLNFTLRIRDRERRLIKKIDEALERIEDGTFGICETCGQEIGTKRLVARPVTTQCISCKTNSEAYEKSIGT
jgi:DnaK suppressor protein